MTTTHWPHLDELRESWVFLLLGDQTIDDDAKSGILQQESQLNYWEIGIGNTDSLVQTNAERIDSDDMGSEGMLIESLLSELEPYRYQGSLLITPDHKSACQLRRRLVAATNIGTPSLRGFNHVILEEKLTQYFDQELHDYEFDKQSRSPPRQAETGSKQAVSSGSARRFWELWLEIFRLIPPAELEGEKV